MQNGLYVSLSAQLALSQRLETVAANVANMNTVGYRAESVTFETQLARAGVNRLSYVAPAATTLNLQSGGLNKTDNPLDVAVQGDGWLAIQTGGKTAYTRDGRLQISATGALENLNGDPVLDAGGAPILVDPAAGPPSIATDGMIAQNGKQIGALGLYAIDPGAKLKRAKGSAVIPDKPATPILDFTRDGIVQGYTENANVNPIQEMAKLITLTRTFDNVNSEVNQTETSLQDAIKELGA